MTGGDTDPGRHRTRWSDAPGFRLAYVREGEGGVPLLFVHGWPDSKRIWWRNIAALAARGFEVIAPDLRGFGESDAGPDGFTDVPSFSRDLHALVHDEFGHERVVAAAGDLGARVIQDLSLRFPGFVDRLVLWNCALPQVAAMEGLDHAPPSIALDYHVRNGTEADALAAELDTPDKRRRYVAGMFTHRWWAGRSSFSAEAVDFQTEPYADAAAFRASLGAYESMYRAERRTGPALLEPNDTLTMVLFGQLDHVVPPDFDRMAALVYSNLVGPYVIRDAGHFVQWEAAPLFNAAVASFCGDLLALAGRLPRPAPA